MIQLQPGVTVVVVSGPAGVGKNEISQRLSGFEYGPKRVRLLRLKTVTTRGRRATESAENDQYHRMTADEFRAAIVAGRFVEWVQNDENKQYYGTLISELEGSPAGSIVLLELTIAGACAIKALCPDALLVFIQAPGWLSLWHRLRGRKTETLYQCALRMWIAVKEMSALPKLRAEGVFAHVVTNHDDKVSETANDVRRRIENATLGRSDLQVGSSE